MIEVRQLSVQKSRKTLLRDIDFDVPTGAFLAVIGPNGGGKSTLIRTLVGLEEHAGSIRFDPPGQPVGYVPQIKTLDRSFPARAEELVATAIRKRWPLSIDPDSRNRVRDALSRVGAEHLAQQQIRSLSGGELQRVYLARALMSKPRILFLDEPSAGVDIAGAMDLLACVESFRADEGATIVMVTHDWDVAAHHASHALVLNQEIISYGPAHEAVNEDALRQAFGHVGHSHAMFGGGHHHD